MRQHFPTTELEILVLAPIELPCPITTSSISLLPLK